MTSFNEIYYSNENGIAFITVPKITYAAAGHGEKRSVYQDYREEYVSLFEKQTIMP